MKDLDKAHKELVYQMRRKKARDAFDGIIALLWTTHSPQEVRDILIAAILDCKEFE